MGKEKRSSSAQDDLKEPEAEIPGQRSVGNMPDQPTTSDDSAAVNGKIVSKIQSLGNSSPVDVNANREAGSESLQAGMVSALPITDATVPSTSESSTANLQATTLFPPPGESGKNPAAVLLGRLGGLKGGKARAKSLTKRERSNAARKAARARWRKSKQSH